MKFLFVMTFIIYVFVTVILFVRVEKLEKAYLTKCDTWNIALAREQADGSIEPQYIRICKEDYETLAKLISK
jgi:hypothetical protein